MAVQASVTDEERVGALHAGAAPSDASRSAPRSLQPLALSLLLALYLCLSLAYNAAVPLGEGPDEGGHFDYALFLAREGRLPVQAREPGQLGDVPGEGHQPPLAYLLMLPVVSWLPPEQLALPLTANPRFVWSGGDEPAAYVRSSQEYWPWSGAVLAWHLARAVSTLLGVATVLATWAAARRLRYGGAAALLAAALVALNPQFLFTSALVTNDALLAALGAGALWVAVERGAGNVGALERGTLEPRTASTAPTLPRSQALALSRSPLLLGLLLGLALITKQSAVLLLPLLPLAAWRQAPGRRARLAYLALAGAVIVAVSGWWYARNAQLYGDALGLGAFRAEFTTQPWEWRDPAAWAGALWQLHESFWARFGWMSVRAPSGLYAAYALLALAAVAGLTGSAVAARRRGATLGIPLAVWALPPLALGWTLSFALTAGLVAWQGRFLFPAVAAVALLLARGLAFWLERRPPTADRRPQIGRLPRLASALLLAGGAVAAGALPFTTIVPSYTWRTLPPARAEAQLGTPAYLRFAENWKRGAELRGWRADGMLRAGGALTVTLTWHALEQVPRDWTVFLHLLDAGGEIVAENNTRPQDGAMPMRLWAPGDWVADPHPILLPATLPPGAYRLRVGLYRPDKADQRRQGVWDARGEFVGDEAILGEIQIGR
jgi:4-amino-4-deoxy-L-arabinose transferase-like glycosyltransferase